MKKFSMQPSSYAYGRGSEPTVALLPWGDLIEDFLDSIGVSFEAFCNEFMGSWMFGYVNSLQLVGVRTVLFCFSTRVDAPMRHIHKPTGMQICLLPVPKIYRAYRAAQHRAVNLYASAKGKSGNIPDARTIGRPLKLRDIDDASSSQHSPLLALRDITKSLASYTISTPFLLFARELRREGCDAILCQDYEFPRFDICVLLGKFLRIPVFGTFQGGNKLPSALEYLPRRLAMRTCTGLIVPTHSEIQRVHTFYGVPLANIARIFNPLDVTTWHAIDRNQARAALDIPLEAQVILWHGRVEIEHKGLDILLEAWKQVCHERPGKDLRLLLVGTGSDTYKLHQCIETMQLRGVMRVDKFVRDRTEIQRYLSAADVYTLPSRREGFPVAPVEAMACGLPLVAADAPGVPDILEEGEASGGLIVPRGDATALALALGRVLDNEAWRHQLGKQARYRVENYFSLETIGEQLRNFLLSQKVRSHYKD